MVHVWVELNGKQTFVDDTEIDPCEDCNNPISICRENGCIDGELEAQMEQGCFWCGAPNAYACRCDNDYESAAGK